MQITSPDSLPSPPSLLSPIPLSPTQLSLPPQLEPALFSPLEPGALHAMDKQRAVPGPARWPNEERKDSSATVQTVEVASSDSVDSAHSNEDTEAKTDDARPVTVVAAGLDDSGDAAKPRRRRTYGQLRVSEDHKRERNRNTFKRFYHRKQQTLRDLRQEEEALAAQYQALVLSRATSTTSDSARPDAPLVQLTVRKGQLFAEHTALEGAAERDIKTRRTLSRIVESLGADSDDETHERIPLPEPPTPEDRERMLRRTLDELRAIRFDWPETLQEDAFGWSCWSQQRGASIEFRLEKRFISTSITAVEIARLTWQFYTDPRPKVARSPMAPLSLVRMHRRILHAVDKSDRTCLVHRCLTPVRRPSADVAMGMIAKSVYLVSKAQLDDAATSLAIISHSVDNQEKFDVLDCEIPLESFKDGDDGDDDFGVLLGAMPRGIHEQWIDELSWWRIEAPPDAGTTVSFSGRAQLCLALSWRAVFMELLRVAMQWEHVVLGDAPVSCRTEDT